MNMNPWLIWEEDLFVDGFEHKGVARDVARGWTEWAVGGMQREWNKVKVGENKHVQEVKKSDVMIGIYRQNRGFERGDKCRVSFIARFESGVGTPKVAVGIDPKGRTKFSEEELKKVVEEEVEWGEFIPLTKGEWPQTPFSHKFTAKDRAQTIFLAVDLNEAEDAGVWLDHVKLELETDRPLPSWVSDGSPPVEPPYIYGMHDSGAEHLFNQKNRKGWIVIRAVDVDADKVRFPQWVDGHGVIVRLDKSEGGDIPKDPKDYDDFAQWCADFAKKSIGAGIWSIGNETKINSGATPEQYALCYCKCRAAIKAVRPGAQVITAGMMHGDPDYFKEVIYHVQRLIEGGECEGIDGFAIHSYTNSRSWDPNVFGEYAKLMAQIPSNLKHLPVYMTEAGSGAIGDETYHSYPSDNTHFIDNIFRYVHDWNQRPDTQKIRSVNFYRWRAHDSWGIEHNQGMIEDFLSALDNEYYWKKP